ncbi:unnamed protein product, partial [Rotaria sp. Silwood1]
MHVSPQTLTVFSCAPGKTILDETYNGRNAVFIESLLNHITKPDVDIE